MLNTLTPEEKEREQRIIIKRLIEHYNLFYQLISFPEDIIPKVDLDMAINSLDDLERKIIILTCLEGYTYRQVENILGIPRTTIGDLKKQAIDKIVKKCMEI
ncbi:sigma factor-like helix-turn-helix DNA-binding protein [Aneurinibacillus thermoaerophilus]|uniref:sigma factor-like helix-turn-helix DNA-binding protein n=1 Tax=Aneurinibacillus thermoaerophilus TaxID=143495 RepID=UPI000B819811|nr:sigma factor-like helix-turn-helix DNA-binding protein [Aneurinibacillus thermoaerophilus]